MKTPRVLIIEDDPSLQRVLSARIKRHSPSVHIDVTDRADEAMCSIEFSAPYDVIFSDYNLTEGTGGDVLSYLKEFHPNMVQKFVFVSANDIVEKLHNRILSKPYITQEILTVLDLELNTHSKES